jgi:hypothetical protein
MSHAFDLVDYRAVQERIAEFYSDWPDGSIRTFLHTQDGVGVFFEARIYRTAEEAATGVYTSGWARESEGATPGTRTGQLEQAERSAVGRALSNRGYATTIRRLARAGTIRDARQSEEHDRLLHYVRTAGARVPPDVVFMIGDESKNLREYVREQWPAIKEQFGIARRVADAIEQETGIAFGEEAYTEGGTERHRASAVSRTR